MTTPNVEEQSGAVSEPQGSATPNVSEQQQQPLSQQGSGDEVLRHKLELLEAELRGLQSKQDKAESKFEQRMKELGVTLTDEQRLKLEVAEIRDALSTRQTSPAAQAQPAQPQANMDFAKVIKGLGLDGNDNDVIAATIKHSGNPEKLKAALADLAVNRTSQAQKPPSPAAIAQPAGQAPSAGSREEIQQKIDSLLTAFPMPKDAPQQIRELSAKLQELE